MDHGVRANDVAMSADGQYLFVAGDNGPSDLSVYSFDGTTLAYVDSSDHGVSANAVAVSADGQYVFLGGINGTSDVAVYGFNGVGLALLPPCEPAC